MMPRVAAAFWLLAPICLSAKSADIHQRLLQALGPETDVQAESFLKEGRFGDVEAMLAQIEGTSSQLGEALALHGAIEFLAGRMDPAVNSFRQAGALSELSEPDRFTLSMALVQLGRDDEARRELAGLAAEWPQKAVYSYWLGRLDYDQRRYAEAVERLKKATELDHRSARAWDSLGLAYDMQSNADQARNAFEEAVRINREEPIHSPWPPHDLGALLLRNGEPKEAVAAFQEALLYDPQMEPAHYHLGRALEKVGADKEALKEYLLAMQEDRKATDVSYSLAMLYRKMGRNEDAQAAFAEWHRRRDAQH